MTSLRNLAWGATRTVIVGHSAGEKPQDTESRDRGRKVLGMSCIIRPHSETRNLCRSEDWTVFPLPQRLVCEVTRVRSPGQPAKVGGQGAFMVHSIVGSAQDECTGGGAAGNSRQQRMLGLLLIQHLPSRMSKNQLGGQERMRPPRGRAAGGSGLLETGKWVGQGPHGSAAQTGHRDWSVTIKQAIREQDQRQVTHPVYL